VKETNTCPRCTAGKPFFVWWNATGMHFRTRVKEEHTDISGPKDDEYFDGTVEHGRQVGELLALIDELGLGENTVAMYSTDNGTHFTSWADAANTPLRSEKNL